MIQPGYGRQVTGGAFTHWEDVAAHGACVVSKPANVGGRVGICPGMARTTMAIISFGMSVALAKWNQDAHSA